MKFKQKVPAAILALALVFNFIGKPIPARAQLSLIRPITFPVIGQVSYYDDFGAPRSGGRTHEGNDLMGKKMMPLVAAVDGTVSFVNYPQPDWGFAVGIRDTDGYQYWYLHINNDTPGSDDGKGDGFFAYAPDIQPGNPVVKGQLIGWMGDSGNAEGTAPHLHFEIHDPSGTPFSPYQSLKAAAHATVPVTVYPALPKEILPYGDFKGGMNIAAANLDSDSNVELVTGAGPSGGPLVRVFEKDGTAKASFFPYDPNFRGGVDVAAADVDGDGVAEIITAPGFGGGPHIRIFKADGTLFKEFMAYDPKFHGGVNVTAADMDNDGKAEIITGPGLGGGPDVRVFKADGTLFKEFMAYDPKLHSGIDVAAAAAVKSRSSSGAGSIVTAPLSGGGPHVKVFDSGGVMTKEFMAYDPNFHGGVRVSAQIGSTASSSGSGQVVTMPASGGGPNLKIFSLVDGTETSSSTAGFETWWRGSYDVTAASDGTVFVSSGPSGRRASLRPSDFGGSGDTFRRGGFRTPSGE